jgi:hypothetical protein
MRNRVRDWLTLLAAAGQIRLTLEGGVADVLSKRWSDLSIFTTCGRRNRLASGVFGSPVSGLDRTGRS